MAQRFKLSFWVMVLMKENGGDLRVGISDRKIYLNLGKDLPRKFLSLEDYTLQIQILDHIHPRAIRDRRTEGIIIAGIS